MITNEIRTTRSFDIFQDFKTGNSQKGKVILILFRVAALATKNRFSHLVLLPYLVFYKIIVEWFLGIELPYNTKVGRGLKLFHGQALVVNSLAVFGENCTLRHSTTIGNLDNGTGQNSCPSIGNNVDIGSNVCIIGKVEIGDNVIIGAGSVVVKNIPSNCVVVGNPAKIIKYL